MVMVAYRSSKNNLVIAPLPMFINVAEPFPGVSLVRLNRCVLDAAIQGDDADEIPLVRLLMRSTKRELAAA